jgi:hypothetical protein
MTTQPEEEEIRQWHKRFAVEANNRAWDLAEQSGLTADEKIELFHTAHASAYHWSQIGTPQQIAQAELLLGHAHATLGNGEVAMEFATSAWDTITSGESAPWEVAFARAILAGAAAAASNPDLHREHWAMTWKIRKTRKSSSLRSGEFRSLKPPSNVEDWTFVLEEFKIKGVLA